MNKEGHNPELGHKTMVMFPDTELDPEKLGLKKGFMRGPSEEEVFRAVLRWAASNGLDYYSDSMFRSSPTVDASTNFSQFLEDEKMVLKIKYTLCGEYEEKLSGVGKNIGFDSLYNRIGDIKSMLITTKMFPSTGTMEYGRYLPEEILLVHSDQGVAMGMVVEALLRNSGVAAVKELEDEQRAVIHSDLYSSFYVSIVDPTQPRVKQAAQAFRRFISDFLLQEDCRQQLQAASLFASPALGIESLIGGFYDRHYGEGYFGDYEQDMRNSADDLYKKADEIIGLLRQELPETGLEQYVVN